MDWIIETFRSNPSIPIFLTIGLGFFVGQLKFKGFSLGTVTSVLLIGVLVGQMDIQIPGPVKNVFFLLFLFAIGYSVGPQFFRALKGDGLKQVAFSAVVCLLCLLCTWIGCKVMGYDTGETLGVFAGAQTMSAAIGAGIDTINSLGADAATKKAWIDIIHEEHSKKPDVVRERIIELVGDLPRVELFARQTTEGWDCWGNEV